MAALVPTCVWRSSPQLLIALLDRFGEPVDAYVNGSQVWLRDDGPGGTTLEWRLHPVPGYRTPEEFGTYEVFKEVAAALSRGRDAPIALDRLWDGLEAFPAYGDEAEPVPLAAAVTESLGLTPDASGLADHQRIGDEWEGARGRVSIIELLLRELSP